jgi:RHS repeat-associated protein
MTYDAGNRLTAATDSFGRTISYQYDVLGNRTQMTAPDGKTTTYSYDAAGRLGKLNYSTAAFSFAYDKLGRAVSASNPNGAVAIYSYDSLSRLRRLIDLNAKGAVNSYTHTYDKTGNRLTKTELKQSFTYSYDPLHRLAGTTANVAGRNEEYTYDPVGNRLTGPATATSYSYAFANELTGKTGGTYQYDNNGNLIGKADGTTTWTYGYDFENRLISVTKVQGSSTSIINFKYDPFGRRIEKSVNDGSTVTTTGYIYDGENVLYEYDRNNAVATRYVHNLGTDNHLAMEKNGKLYVYYKDTLGSVIAITDYWGNIVQTYDYDSFGNIVSIKDPTFEQPYTYTGREWDKETGLYYYRARYYDPMEGRFIQKDPSGFDGGINLYVYVGNSPLNRTDPTGLKWVWYCKRRLAWSTSPLVSSLFPFVGHCYMKFGDEPLGFYQTPEAPNWTVLDERTPGASTPEGGERTLIINRWCRPSWVSDCEYNCLRSRVSVGAQGAPIGGSPLSNNCCTNLDAVRKECKEKCCGK